MKLDSAKKCESLESLVPQQVWFTLKEACEIKNLNYKTSCNKTYLQPNRGKPDGRVGGRKMWKRETVLEWVILSDEQIQEAM